MYELVIFFPASQPNSPYPSCPSTSLALIFFCNHRELLRVACPVLWSTYTGTGTHTEDAGPRLQGFYAFTYTISSAWQALSYSSMPLKHRNTSQTSSPWVFLESNSTLPWHNRVHQSCCVLFLLGNDSVCLLLHEPHSVYLPVRVSVSPAGWWRAWGWGLYLSCIPGSLHIVWNVGSAHGTFIKLKWI